MPATARGCQARSELKPPDSAAHGAPRTHHNLHSGAAGSGGRRPAGVALGTAGAAGNRSAGPPHGVSHRRLRRNGAGGHDSTDGLGAQRQPGLANPADGCSQRSVGVWPGQADLGGADRAAGEPHWAAATAALGQPCRRPASGEPDPLAGPDAESPGVVPGGCVLPAEHRGADGSHLGVIERRWHWRRPGPEGAGLAVFRIHHDPAG